MANLNLLSKEGHRQYDEVHQYEDMGRPARTLAGSHLADLIHLKKTILLCDSCARKFTSASRNGYVTDNRTMPKCCARCDACKENGMDRSVYVHRSNIEHF